MLKPDDDAVIIEVRQDIRMMFQNIEFIVRHA